MSWQHCLLWGERKLAGGRGTATPHPACGHLFLSRFRPEREKDGSNAAKTDVASCRDDTISEGSFMNIHIIQRLHARMPGIAVMALGSILSIASAQELRITNFRIDAEGRLHLTHTADV